MSWVASLNNLATQAEAFLDKVEQPDLATHQEGDTPVEEGDESNIFHSISSIKFEQADPGSEEEDGTPIMEPTIDPDAGEKYITDQDDNDQVPGEGGRDMVVSGAPGEGGRDMVVVQGDMVRQELTLLTEELQHVSEKLRQSQVQVKMQDEVHLELRGALRERVEEIAQLQRSCSSHVESAKDMRELVAVIMVRVAKLQEDSVEVVALNNELSQLKEDERGLQQDKISLQNQITQLEVLLARPLTQKVKRVIEQGTCRDE
eukprot:sb/3468480/